jgi:lambda family phage tail tape measure protein
MAPKNIRIVIQGDGESAKTALAMVREQMAATAEQARNSGSEIGEAMEKVKRALEWIVLYDGIREVVSGIKELAVGSLELGETLEQAAKKTGLSVESLSVLHYAAGVLGTDFNSLVTGVGRMDKAIGAAADGNKEAAALMKALGVNAKDLAGRTDGAEIAFHKFVSVLAATDNPVRRTQLAMQLLGRAGAEQIPVLLEIGRNWDTFKQKAQEAGVVLDGETAAKLADTSQRLQDLKQHAIGAGLAFTEGLTPSLDQMFNVISSGQGQMDTMKTWGQDIGRILAFVGEVAYTAAAGLEYAFGAGELGKFTEAGRRDLAAAKELMQKAQEMHDVAFGDKPPGAAGKPFLPEGGGAGGPGFGGAGVGARPKSDNSIGEAAAQLAAEQAKVAADARRALDEQNLAELEAQHRMGLVADGEFYTEKARLESDAFDAEQQSLRQHLAALQALETRQHADKGLKRDKAGNSAEELRTQKEMLQIQDQLAQVEARRGQKGSQDTAQADAGNKEAELARLKVAAELEKQRNDGITARLALLRREADIEAQKVHNAGGSDADVAQVRALEQIEEQKLQIEEVTRQITAAEQAHKLAVDAVQDAERKGLLTKRAGQQQINQLNRQEAATLQQLVAQYTALAQVLGGDYLQKARALQATLAQLGRPDNQSDNQFAKQIGQGLSGVIDKFADSAARGKQSFHSMTLSMLQDIEALAVKMATERWLTPLLTSAFGGAGGGSGAVPSAGPDIASALWESHASGGTSSDNAQVVGEKGPEIWQPPTRGGTILPTAAVRALGEGGGGGGRAPSITQNIINNSSQPVTAQAPQVSFDTQLKSYVINTVLEDHAQGGPIAQSMRGLGAG